MTPVAFSSSLPMPQEEEMTPETRISVIRGIPASLPLDLRSTLDVVPVSNEDPGGPVPHRRKVPR
ncbi:hypothetical protein [Roseovarius sp. D0-M9]|uniref:hypothetical protein n=1 Tax=Roseovarius sp. D0-M9 TaxID=3127117 RepID=UPI00300F7CD2